MASRSCAVAALALALVSGPAARADHPAREPMTGVELGVAGRGTHDLGPRVTGWAGVDLTGRLALFALLQYRWFDHGQENAVGGGVRVWPSSRVYLEGRFGAVIELRDRIAGTVHDGRQPMCHDHESECGWIAGGTLGIELVRDDALVVDLRLSADHAAAGSLSGDALAASLAFDVY